MKAWMISVAALLTVVGISSPRVAGRSGHLLLIIIGLAVAVVAVQPVFAKFEQRRSEPFVPTAPRTPRATMPNQMAQIVEAFTTRTSNNRGDDLVPAHLLRRITTVATGRIVDHHHLHIGDAGDHPAIQQLVSPHAVDVAAPGRPGIHDRSTRADRAVRRSRRPPRRVGASVTSNRGTHYPPPPPPDGIDCERAAATVSAVIDEVERAVVGKRAELELVVAALLAGGHVLLDDVPGVAKTLAARSIATAAGLSFSRIQFTPDVLPSDITGATVIDVHTGHPTFRRGPVFAELVLADEINRAPAKTQAALLEAMQEFQVTIDGTTHRLPNPFFVIATENPVESEGTYPLPEAQLDRFIVRAHLGYPAVVDEVEMVSRRLARGTDEVVIRQVTNTAQLDAVRAAIERVYVEPVLVAYVVDIINASRKHRELSLGASPRGSLAVIKVARARAVLQGRDFVTPDDVRAIALPALTHRVVLSDEAWARGTRAHDVMRAVVDSVAAPSWK